MHRRRWDWDPCELTSAVTQSMWSEIPWTSCWLMGEYNRFIWPTPLEMQYSHFCKAGWLCLNVFWGFIARYYPTEYSCKNTPMWAQLLVAVYKNWVFFNRLMKWVRSMTYTLHSRGWLWQPSTNQDFEWSLFAPNCQGLVHCAVADGSILLF